MEEGVIWERACICGQGRIWLDGRVRCQIAGLGREHVGQGGMVVWWYGQGG